MYVSMQLGEQRKAHECVFGVLYYWRRNGIVQGEFVVYPHIACVKRLIVCVVLIHQALCLEKMFAS